MLLLHFEDELEMFIWVSVSLSGGHIDQIASLSAALSADNFWTAALLISRFMLNLIQVSSRRKMVYQGFSGPVCEMFVKVSWCLPAT